MNKLLLILIFNFFVGKCIAQNLVPNPSFEDTVVCPDDISQIDRCVGWFGCGQSPDYFNTCGYLDVKIPANIFGYQYAATGRAYGGIGIYATTQTDVREIISAKLLQPLVMDRKYFVRMNVSLADKALFTSNNLGFSFSTKSRANDNASGIVNKNNPMVFDKTIIKDYTNWVNIKGSFVADSNYQYILIGNFYTDSLTQRGASTSPNALANMSYYYIDDVCVSTDSMACVSKVGISSVKARKGKQFDIYPNPFNDNLTISGAGNEPKQIIIFDLLAREVKRQKFTEKTTLDMQDLHQGLYFYEIRNEFGFLESGKIIKE